MAQGPRRVAVTGLGLLTPLGLDTESTWDGLIAGRSGIAPITAFDTSAFECPIAGELRGFDPAQHVDSKIARRIDRSSMLAIAASKQAVQDAQLDLERQPPGSVGIVLGTGIGGAHLLVENQQVLDERGPRRVSPFLITNMLPDTASGLVAIALGAGGPNLAVTAACATGGAAVGEAAEMIRRGAADVIIAGGFEAPLKPIYYSGFQAMRALAVHDDPTQASRPFDADRNGFVISEGAGALILEELEHALARAAHASTPSGRARPRPATPSTWLPPPMTAAASCARCAGCSTDPAWRRTRSTTSTRTGRVRRSTTASRRSRSAPCSARTRTTSRSPRRSRCWGT